MEAGCKAVNAFKDGQPTGRTVLILADLGRTKGIEFYGKPKPVSQATYYRWLRAYSVNGDQTDLAGEFSQRGRRNQVAPTVKQIAHTAMAMLIRICRKSRSSTRANRGSNLEPSIKRRAKPSKPAGAAQASLRAPVRSNVVSILVEFPAYVRNVALWGRVKARAMHRGPPTADEEPTLPLDLVQFDETLLPLMIVDEMLGIALGRPWLAWLVDVCTQGILGSILASSRQATS